MNNKIRYNSEEYECAMEYLDKLGVATKGDKGHDLSLVGRIFYLMQSVAYDSGSYSEHLKIPGKSKEEKQQDAWDRWEGFYMQGGALSSPK